MSNLFISHSSRDNAAAKGLQARLEEQGHRSVFLDLDPETGIQAGVSWERTLYTKLRACRAVVALCSDSYLASQWCFAEIALARMEGKELFVLQIDPWSEQTQMPSILTEEQYIDLRTNPDDGYQRLWNGFEVKGIVAAEQRQWTAGKSPYPGLRAFEEEDAAVFFGRDDEVRDGVELLNRVRRQGHPRLVMVLGSSGSGKSSLARAGIVPQLRRDAERWLVVGPFRPGRQPAVELALALSKAFNEAGKPRPWEEILGRLDLAALESAGTAAEPPGSEEAGGEQLSAREVLREALLRMEGELTADDSQVVESVQRLKEYLESSPATTRSVRAARAGDPGSNPLAALATELRLDNELPEAKVVLVIDQFEELLGHENDGEDHPANRFLSLLKGGIEAEDNPPLALGTMRSDFLGMLQRSDPLRGVGFKSLSVGPMSEEGMRKVIEEPATLGQIDLEKPELTNLLLRETGTPDALPLLAFTLRAMWDRYHETRRFDVQGYEALGGLQGAIAQVADDTMEAALAKSEEGTEKDLRVAFLSLARPAAEGTGWARQPASWDEMPERVQPMIQQFIDQRLLVKRADGTVEVAHEALFRSWETLRGWLNANAEGLYLLREIRIDAEKWQKAKSDADKEPYLWRAGRLARALELRDRGVLKLKELDTSFIDRSESEEKRKLAEEEARRKAELEQARKLAEEQRKLAEEQRKRAEEQAKSARRTKIGAAGLAALFVGAALLAFYANSQKIAAQDQTKIAIASEWLKRDPTRAALVLLELRRPQKTPRALQLMSEALAQPLALAGWLGHDGPVWGAAFSPKGDRIVTASEDNTVRVWGAASGRELLALSHDSYVERAAFNPDGDRIVTASGDKTARIWDAETGRELFVFQHETPLTMAAFDHEGDRIVTVAEKVEEEGKDPENIARIWQADDPGEPPVLLVGHSDEVQSAVFSPDGDTIVTAAKDKTARVWRSDGTPLHVLEHKDEVWSAVFSPKGDRIVTGSKDGIARVWNADGGGGPIEFRGHTEKIRAVAFSADGDRVITASDDETLRIWKVDGSGEPAIFRVDAPLTIGVRPTGDRFVSGHNDGSVRVWSIPGRREPLILRHEGEVHSAAFSPSGDRIVTASKDKKARVWAVDGGDESLELEHDDEVFRAAFSPTGDRIGTASKDKTAWIWQADGSATIRLRGHDAEVYDAAFSPKGDRVVTASKDGTARVWQTDGTGLAVLRGHREEVYSAAFSPSGERIVTASEDGTARVWTAAGEELFALSHGPLNPVYSATFSPSGDRIATASFDFKVRVWRADGPGDSPLLLAGHESPVGSTAFSPDGDRIVTASFDGTARVWRADGSGEALVLPVHKAAPPDWWEHWKWGASFSPTGESIVVTSHDKTARIWPVSYHSMAATIRAATDVCLDPAFRRRSLDEGEKLAGKRYSSCTSCVSTLRERSFAGGSKEAVQAYKRCLRDLGW